MLEFFKKNHLFNSLLLLPYALVVRIVVIVFPQARLQGDTFAQWGEDVLAAIHQWGAEEYLLSSFLVFIQAAMINRICIRQSMLGDINLFPGVCYVLLTALHPSFISVSSPMIANTALLIALGYLFDVLKKERQEETRFMAGWWLGLTGLLFAPYLMLILFGLIAMSMLKSIKTKDIFQYLTGYISPFVIGYLLQVILTDRFVIPYGYSFSEFGIPQFQIRFTISDIITICILGVLLLICIMGYAQIVARKNIHAQKKIDILYVFVFFTLLMTLFPAMIEVPYLYTLLIPMAIFLAIMLRLIRNPAIAESIHFILVVAALLTQVLLLV